MALTDTAIKNTKPADKPRKLADGGGLYLLLNPNGSRWWRLDYPQPVKLGERITAWRVEDIRALIEQASH